MFSVWHVIPQRADRLRQNLCLPAANLIDKARSHRKSPTLSSHSSRTSPPHSHPQDLAQGYQANTDSKWRLVPCDLMILARLLSVGILTFYNKTWCVRKAMGGEEGSGHAAGRKEAKVQQLWGFFFSSFVLQWKKTGGKDGWHICIFEKWKTWEGKRPAV